MGHVEGDEESDLKRMFLVAPVRSNSHVAPRYFPWSYLFRALILKKAPWSLQVALRLLIPAQVSSEVVLILLNPEQPRVLGREQESFRNK